MDIQGTDTIDIRNSTPTNAVWNLMLDACPQLDFTLTDPYLSPNANSTTSGGWYTCGRTPTEPNVPTPSMLGVGAGGAQGKELERNSTPSFSFSLAAGLASEGASPLSSLSLRGSPLSPCGEAPFEHLLKQGYPGDSSITLEQCAVPRRAIFNETDQLLTRTREIKKLADIQRFTYDIPEDPLPSSGRKPATLTLPCAWVECNYCCSRPDRLKAHVFTHIDFKPFPCDRRCGDPHRTAKFYSKGDCHSYQTRARGEYYLRQLRRGMHGEEPAASRARRSVRGRTPCSLVRHLQQASLSTKVWARQVLYVQTLDSRLVAPCGFYAA